MSSAAKAKPVGETDDAVGLEAAGAAERGGAVDVVVGVVAGSVEVGDVGPAVSVGPAHADRSRTAAIVSLSTRWRRRDSGKAGGSLADRFVVPICTGGLEIVHTVGPTGLNAWVILRFMTPIPVPARLHMKRVISTFIVAVSIAALSATVVLAAPPTGATGHGEAVSAIAHAAQSLSGQARGAAISAVAKTHGAEVSAAAKAKGAAASAAGKAKGAAAAAAGKAKGAAASAAGKANGAAAAAAAGAEGDAASEPGRLKAAAGSANQP